MIRALLFSALFSATLCANGQNFILEMFHPLSQQMVALQTDSIFIRTVSEDGKEDRREVAYAYDSEHKLVESRETVHASNNQFIYHIKEERDVKDVNFPRTFIHRYDSTLNAAFEYRTISFAHDPTQVDSSYLEYFYDNQWLRSQVTKYKYFSSGLIEERTDYGQSEKPGEWVMRTQTLHDYTSDGRIKTRISNNWPADQPSFQNLYRYHYDIPELPEKESWYSGDIGNAQPVDSTRYFFDAQGKYDSAHHYTWVAQLNDWVNTSREEYPDDEQKRTLTGDKSYPDVETGIWHKLVKHEYTSGTQVYTAEPYQHTIERLNRETHQWEVKGRQTTTYALLDTVVIYATFRNEAYTLSGQWETTCSAEAWLHINPDSLPQPREGQFRFSYICGMPSPYIANETVTFPERAEFPGRYELRLMSSDGRLVYHKIYDESGVGTVDAVLNPGFYIAFVSKGGMPVCSQKMVVQNGH